VHCKNFEIEGSLDGKIFVTELLSLRARSKVLGDISTSKLAIEPGAVFTGKCDMSGSIQNPNATKPTESKENNSSGLNKYVEYSGIAFQMVAIILAFVWAGKKIDEKFFNGESVFIIVFSLLGVLISMYFVIKDFIKISRKK